MAERVVRKDKGKSLSTGTKSESTVTAATSPLSRLPASDHRDAGQTDLKRKASELSKFSEGFAGLNDSINQLIPPTGCTPPTAADLLKSQGKNPNKEVGACNPVEYAATASPGEPDAKTQLQD